MEGSNSASSGTGAVTSRHCQSLTSRLRCVKRIRLEGREPCLSSFPFLKPPARCLPVRLQLAGRIYGEGRLFRSRQILLRIFSSKTKRPEFFPPGRFFSFQITFRREPDACQVQRTPPFTPSAITKVLGEGWGFPWEGSPFPKGNLLPQSFKSFSFPTTQSTDQIIIAALNVSASTVRRAHCQGR